MAARLSEVSVLLALCAAADCCLEPYWFRPEAGIEQVACGLHCFILIGGPYGRVVKDGQSWRRSSGSPSFFGLSPKGKAPGQGTAKGLGLYTSQFRLVSMCSRRLLPRAL